jgi:hypothetical protein
MGSVKINMAKSEVLPEGTYPVEVEAVVVKESQRQTLYLEFVLRVDDGQGGRTIWMHRSLEKALEMVVRDLKALGIEADGELDFEWDQDARMGRYPDSGYEVFSPVLVGRKALAVIYHAEWEGEIRPKVRRLIASDA